MSEKIGPIFSSFQPTNKAISLNKDTKQIWKNEIKTEKKKSKLASPYFSIIPREDFDECLYFDTLIIYVHLCCTFNLYIYWYTMNIK